MKNITLLLVSLILIGVSSQVLAGKDPKGIRHCGCIYVATDEVSGDAFMIYKDLLVSKKSKGHRNHLVDSMDDCLTGYEMTEDPELGTIYTPLYDAFVRTGDDCLLSGTDPLLAACDLELGPAEGDLCGELYVPEPD